MVDKWTLIAADKTSLSIQVQVDGYSEVLTATPNDLDTSNEQDLLTAIRDLVTRYRDQHLASQTPLAVVANLVGHSEEF
jgi:hypothetical protein